MTGEHPSKEARSVIIDGVDVGVVETIMVLPDGRKFGPVTLELRFRPDWPGLFRLMALAADEA